MLMAAGMPKLSDVGKQGITDYMRQHGCSIEQIAEEIQRQLDHIREPEDGKMGFNLLSDGLYYDDKRYKDSINGPIKRTRICSRIEVLGLTRDEQGSWGQLLKLTDPDGKSVEQVIPMGVFERGDALRETLRNLGLYIEPTTEAKNLVLQYLQTQQPTSRVCVVKKVGWHDGVFVLPDAVFGTPAGNFRCDIGTHDYRTAGTLQDWQREIARYCEGNSRLLLAVSAAFAGPLLEFSPEAESGGFHFRALTSTGKTTAQKIADSVWGGSKLLESWRTTSNGLEATAEKHNFGLLCLDELGQISPREAGDAAYQLANGKGKGRMDKNIKGRESLAWQLIFLSSGEISLADHMREGGRKIRGGQQVRVVDVPADAGRGWGLFENLHNFKEPKLLAEHLVSAVQRCFGTPIHAFLQHIVDHKPDVSKLLAESQSKLIEKYVDLSGEIYRVAKLFALVAVAGELATGAGVTGWPEGAATEGVQMCFDTWLTERGLKPADATAAVGQVRLFLEQHESRFVIGDDNGSTQAHNRVGFKRVLAKGEVEYCVFSESFQQTVCAGFDPKMVARALRDQGHLVVDGANLKAQRVIPGTEKQKTRVYVIRGSILAGELEL